MYEFETEVQVEQYGVRGLTLGYNQKINIKWSLELEMRGWGIKDFVVSAPDQEVTLMKILHEDEDSETEEPITLMLKNIKCDFAPDKGLSPDFLEIYVNDDGTVESVELT